MNELVNQQSLNELALFAGAGGGILGGKLLGWRTVCAVEWEPYPASVLVARQNEGILPPFPIWDDVQTFDGKPWEGIVDVVSGGFPCQDISAAGKGAGIEGARSGMWTHMARIIGEVRPRYAFVENSPMLTTRGLGTVLADLAKMGFDAKWCVLGAADVGAPHQRNRIWIVAKQMGNTNNNGQITSEIGASIAQRSNTSKKGEKQTGQFARSSMQSAHVADTESKLCNGCKNNARVSMESCSESEFGNNSWQNNVADTDSTQFEGNERTERIKQEYTDIGSASWWKTEPDVGRVADGVAARVDRLKAVGNGQVPRVAAAAFSMMANN